MDRERISCKSKNNIGVRKLFPLIFSCTITVFIAFLIMTFSHYVSEQILENVKKDTERQTEVLSSDLEREISSMSDMINQVYYRSVKNNDYKKNLADDLNLIYQQNSERIAGIDLYMKSSGKQIFSTNENKYTKKDYVLKYDWFQNAGNNIELVSFGEPRISVNGNNIVRTIPVSRYVELKSGGKLAYGILKIDFYMSDIKSVLNSYNSNEVDYCYLLNENNKILYHPFGKEIAGDMFDEWSIKMLDKGSSLTAENNKRKWYIKTHQVGYTGWKLVIVNSLTDIRRKNQSLYIIIWTILCGTGIIMILTDIMMLRFITYPVSELSETMESFGAGNLNTRAEENGVAELRTLSHNFNIMAAKIQTQLNQIIKDEKEKRHMERRLLQAQITPHFLYNTLDSIIWMIQSGEYDDAGKMVSLLAKLFRISLSQGKDIIPLRKEIEHAVSYLSIQNIRFKDKFEFKVEADEALLDYLCPKITIQPILENAVYHGMEGKYDDGEIILSVHERNGNICIDVSDNGEGMTPEQIDYIMHNKVVSSKRGSGVGVHNVDDRLKLLYGKDFGVEIISVIDEGTTVRLTIPKVREINED